MGLVFLSKSFFSTHRSKAKYGSMSGKEVDELVKAEL